MKRRCCMWPCSAVTWLALINLTMQRLKLALAADFPLVSALMPARHRNENGGSNKLVPATGHSQSNRKINILMWFLRNLTTLNIKLLVDFSGIIRSKMQLKESIQLKERTMDLDNVA